MINDLIGLNFLQTINLLAMKTGIIVLVIGFVLNYIINRRRFNRRSVAGVQLFKSYEHAFAIRIIEQLGKWLAIILMLFGVLQMLVSYK